ncbi:MAG: DUF4430 domain-containing protein [Ruminococcus sp.]|nr:DUF4430 domain-containing protein [Ruminococcus sp.]
MKENKKTVINKKILMIIIGILILVALCTGLWFIYSNTRDNPISGEKNITLEVVSERDNYNFSAQYNTSDEYLGDFLDKENLIGFETSEYGRFVKSVQGYEAKDEEQSWWNISINGESAVTGVDEIVLEDGSVYKLELMIGWQ